MFSFNRRSEDVLYAVNVPLLVIDPLVARVTLSENSRKYTVPVSTAFQTEIVYVPAVAFLTFKQP